MTLDRRRVVVAALTAAACAGAAAAPASAQQPAKPGGPRPYDVRFDGTSVYDVRFDGTVTYQHRRVYDAEHFEDESTSFRVTVRGGGVTFRNRMVMRPLNTPDIQLSIPRTETHQVTDDGPIDCRGTGGAATGGFAHLGASDPFSRGEGLVIFVPFAGVEIAMTCTEPEGTSRARLVLDNPWQPELPDGRPAKPPAFGYVFSPFATNEPDPTSLKVPIDRTAPAKACPNRDVYTRSCVARLNGTLVLTRTGGTPLADRGGGSGGGGGRRIDDRSRARARRPARTPRRARGRRRKG